jgi:glycosyltransferase involved in cell wall biosynthesis
VQNLYIFGQTKKNSNFAVGLWQIAPFTLFKNELQKSGYKVIRKHASTVEEITRLTLNLNKPNIIIIRPEWTENQNDVLLLCKKLRDRYPVSKILMIDPFDQTTSRFFESLPYLDAMLKYQSLSDKNLYLKLKDYAGGVYLNQKLKEEVGIETPVDWSVTSCVQKGQEHKIVSGNFMIDNGIVRNIQNPLTSYLIGLKKKNIDIFAHMSCGKRGDIIWYGEHRIKAVEYLKKLTQFNISVEAEYSGEPRISRREYIRRGFASKIVYSPLGWGEMTLRPMEAIANRSMLIMPEVSHIDVFPNIFIPYETYVPVKLDLSDLAEKCEYYLNYDSKRIEITNNARKTFLREFTAEKFIKHMEAIINL